jgi:flagellar hook assembly protein FlgD
VRLEVTDIAGRVVTVLFDGVKQAGRFELSWDGTHRGERLQSGVYFVRLTTKDRTVARRITLLS